MKMDQLQELQGAPVYDASGDQIGKIEEIFVDLDSRQPEWIGLGTGFFGTKRVLIAHTDKTKIFPANHQLLELDRVLDYDRDLRLRVFNPKNEEFERAALPKVE